MTRKYVVAVCPLCGTQVEIDDFYGEGYCPTHGKVEPFEVAVTADGATTTRAWLVRNGLSERWELTDPRTQDYGGPRPVVLESFVP